MASSSSDSIIFLGSSVIGSRNYTTFSFEIFIQSSSWFEPFQLFYQRKQLVALKRNLLFLYCAKWPQNLVTIFFKTMTKINYLCENDSKAFLLKFWFYWNLSYLRWFNTTIRCTATKMPRTSWINFSSDISTVKLQYLSVQLRPYRFELAQAFVSLHSANQILYDWSLAENLTVKFYDDYKFVKPFAQTKYATWLCFCTHLSS